MLSTAATAVDCLASLRSRVVHDLTRANRKKPKCTIPNVRGALTVSAHVGTNRVRFQGRQSRTKKPRAAYRETGVNSSGI